MMDSPAHNSRARLLDLLFFVAVAAVLYLRFFRLPMTPIDPASDDQAVYLWSATKLLAGQIMYRDFFQFSTPGTDYLYALLIKVFGQTAVMPKFVALSVGVLFAMEGVLLSRLFLHGWRAYVPALLFLTAGFLPLPDATHHVFSTLAAIAGLIVILSQPQAGLERCRSFTAGALAAVSLCFTHSRGPLVFAALCWIHYIFRKEDTDWMRQCAVMFCGFVLVSVVLLLPIFWQAGMGNVINALIDFPLSSYRAVPGNTFGAYGVDLPMAWQSGHSATLLLQTVRWLLIYLLVPWIYVAVVFHSWRSGSSHKLMQALIVMGIALFLSIAYGPTHFRLGIISLPAFIALIWWLESLQALLARELVMLLALFAGVSFVAGIVHSQGPGFALVHTPAGEIAASPSHAALEKEKFDWLSRHTKPGDPVFIPNYDAAAYLFRLQPLSPVSQMWINGYTTPQQVQRTIDELQRTRAAYAIWPEDFQTSNTTGGPNELAPIEQYLRNNFVLDHTFSDSDQVWRKKSD